MCFSTTEDDCSAGRNVLEINRKIYPRLFSSMFTLLGIQDESTRVKSHHIVTNKLTE